MKTNKAIQTAYTEALKENGFTDTHVKQIMKALDNTLQNAHIVKSGKGFKLTLKDDESDKLKNKSFYRINQNGTKKQEIKNLSSLQNKLSYSVNKVLFKETNATQRKNVIDLVNKILNNEVVSVNSWTYGVNDNDSK